MNFKFIYIAFLLVTQTRHICAMEQSEGENIDLIGSNYFFSGEQQQPLSLQELCYKVIASFFSYPIFENVEQEILQNITISLPEIVITSLVSWCLQGEFVEKQFPFSIVDFIEISEGNRYAIQYQTKSEYCIGAFAPTYSHYTQIKAYDLAESNCYDSFGTAVSLLSKVKISPSGHFYAWLSEAYQKHGIRIMVRDILHKKMVIDCEKNYSQIRGALTFYDDNTLIINLGKRLLMYKINDRAEYEMTLDAPMEEHVLLWDRFLIYLEKISCSVSQGNRFASRIKIHDIENKQQKPDLGYCNSAICLLESNNSDLFAIAPYGGSGEIWQINQQAKVVDKKKIGGEEKLTNIKLDPSSTFLITESLHGPLKIWDIESEQIIFMIPGSDDLRCNGIFWSFDNNEILIKRIEGFGHSSTDNYSSYAPKNLRLGLMLMKLLQSKNIDNKPIQ